jgi:hypothetical protein
MIENYSYTGFLSPNTDMLLDALHALENRGYIKDYSSSKDCAHSNRGALSPGESLP